MCARCGMPCRRSVTFRLPLPIISRRGALRALPSAAEVQQRYGSMPTFLEAALLPFQREGVTFGLAHGGRCLIGEMRGLCE